MLLGKGAVDGLGGTVKRSVWKFVKAGGNIPADAMHHIQELLVNAIQTKTYFSYRLTILKNNQMR